MRSAESALELAQNAHEAIQVANQANALEFILRATKAADAIHEMARIKVIAQRKAGEFLSKELKHGGDRASSTPSTLEKLDISKDDSSKWQKIAKMPTWVFDRYMANHSLASTNSAVTESNHYFKILKTIKENGIEDKGNKLLRKAVKHKWGVKRLLVEAGVIQTEQVEETVEEETEDTDIDCNSELQFAEASARTLLF